MSATFDCTARCCPKEPLAQSRRGVAEKIAQFDTLDSPWTSCRRIAGQLEVPARTLYHWVHRERTLIAKSSWPKRVARFLESPEGLDFLHRLFTAAHLVLVHPNLPSPLLTGVDLLLGKSPHSRVGRRFIHSVLFKDLRSRPRVSLSGLPA